MSCTPVDVIGAEANRRFGHIALGSGNGPAEVTFVDLGSELHMWAYSTACLNAAAARNLAAALTSWADRKEAGR